MMAIDLAKPPRVDTAWLQAFTRHFVCEEPDASALTALEHALVVFDFAWLLEPQEAVDYWLKAIRSRGWRAGT